MLCCTKLPDWKSQTLSLHTPHGHPNSTPKTPFKSSFGTLLHGSFCVCYKSNAIAGRTRSLWIRVTWGKGWKRLSAGIVLETPPSGLDVCRELLKTAGEKEEYSEELADKGVLNSRYKYQQWGSVRAKRPQNKTGTEQTRGDSAGDFWQIVRVL